jgi:hypothetical protein
MSRPVTQFMRFASLSFLTLALLGILIRSLIPTGFMPEFSQAGTAFVICSGVEIKTVYLDENGQPTSGHQVEAPCDFSINTVAIKQLIPVSSLFVPYVATLFLPEHQVHFSDRTIFAHTEARGPPSLTI